MSHYLRKSEAYLWRSITALAATGVFGFLTVTRFKGDDEPVSGSIFLILAIISAVFSYRWGKEASRCQAIHHKRYTEIN